MKRKLLVGLSITLLILFSAASVTFAFSVHLETPGYKAENFLTLGFKTTAMAFDPAGNFYTNDRTESVTGTFNILKYTTGNYNSFSTYASYDSAMYGINGLDFDAHGQSLCH